MLWLLAGMRKRLDVFEARVRTALGDGVPRILSRAREGGDTVREGFDGQLDGSD